MSSRERRLREKTQILRECRGVINRLTNQAYNEIEKKYETMYGENWRQNLSVDRASVIEATILGEKNLANDRIEELIFGLKSTECSDNAKLIRR